MILALRQRHRRVVIVLTVFLPVAFVVGIAFRKPIPSMAALPGNLSTTAQKFAFTEWERDDLFRSSPIHVRLLRENAGSGQFALELRSAKDFIKPDLIVYWVAGKPNATGKLPDEARLLGAFNSSVMLPLPEAAASGGALVLYSLADQEIIETSQPLAVQKP